MEEDGIGQAPEELRAVLIDAEGFWAVRVPISERVKTAAIIRKAFGLSLESSLNVLQSFPVINVGTKQEATWFAGKLIDARVAASLETVSDKQYEIDTLW